MKYIIIVLFFICFQAQSQDSIQSQNISVISAEKLNVVYRGVPNPIKIAVPGAKSFIATGQGLVKTDSIGNYKLSAGPGNTVTVSIYATMQDNSVKHEEKVFRIKSFPALTAILNDDVSNTYNMTREDLIKSQVNVTLINMPMYESNVDFGVRKFDIRIPTKHGKIKTFTVIGNIMTDEVIAELKKVKKGSVIMIYQVSAWQNIFKGYFDKISLIGVKIIEK